MYLSYRGDQIMSVLKGTAPADLKPVGLNPPGQNVFTMVEQDGKPVLRISGEIYGCATTTQEFSNYHFRASFKWGEKKWEPRLTELKDSGILYHSRGAFGVDYWKSWALSQEFQVIEHGIGEYWRQATSEHRHPRGSEGAGRRSAEVESRRRPGWSFPGLTTTRSRVRTRIARANGTRSSWCASRTAACTSPMARWSWR